jgi:hypothetical protein
VEKTVVEDSGDNQAETLLSSGDEKSAESEAREGRLLFHMVSEEDDGFREVHR